MNYCARDARDCSIQEIIFQTRLRERNEESLVILKLLSNIDDITAMQHNDGKLDWNLIDSEGNR